MSDVFSSMNGAPSERVGNPWVVFGLALGLTCLVLSYSFVTPDEASRLTLVLLVTWSIIGVAALFALALGFLQFTINSSGRSHLSQTIMDMSTDALVMTLRDGYILYANQTYLTLSRATATNPPTVERLFSGPAEVSEAIYRLVQAAREGKSWSEELRLSPALVGSQAVGWYRIRVTPVVEKNKSKEAILWTISDITRERTRHENVFQELKHAVDFLDHAPAGFLSIESNGVISYVNATLAQWLGYDLAQVGTGGLCLGDVVAGQGASLFQTLSGRAGEVRTEQMDLDLKRKDGQNFPVRILHRVVFSHDGTPGPSRTLIMSRAKGEEPAENARAAEVRLARFFNQTPFAIACVDSSGHLVQTNPAFARLCPDAMRGRAQNRSIYTIISERDRNRLEAAIEAAIKGKGEIDPIDVVLLGGGEAGKEHTARFFVSPDEVQSQDHQGIAYIFALDTTEQRVLEENFTQSQKMNAIGQLAGGVAHDFNNVLTAIIGYSDLLLANHRPTDPSFQDIMQIKQNANRAAGLVRQLLAFSRRQTLRPQVLSLLDVLSDLQMLLHRLVGEKIELDVKHGRDLWLVKADLNQFEQVMVNLVVNARDAMPEGGHIWIRTRNVSSTEDIPYREISSAPGDYVLIEVEDNGTGIKEDIRSKIFEPFFTTKEIGKGTGLGLSTVYGIVKQTGGWIFCESEWGKGTTFRIFLPRYVPIEQDHSQKVQEVSSPPVSDATGFGTILLVEDEEAVRAFGARALVSRGYRVLEAASGLQALEMIEQNEEKVDLIVSDVVMPEMDGPTMFGELRKRGIHCKVIFVSGYAEDAFAKNLPEGEEFGFLAKPFSLKQLIEVVKSHMNG